MFSQGSELHYEHWRLATRAYDPKPALITRQSIFNEAYRQLSVDLYLEELSAAQLRGAEAVTVQMKIYGML